ncbi:hypothetical protein NCCP2145_21940 [Pseudarthrobacter sp. NCCP-2145]|nr:hypothetical protein NCCP2145_21940 [Pseudarthrobacter sp. NCCP-2145]
MGAAVNGGRAFGFLVRLLAIEYKVFPLGILNIQAYGIDGAKSLRRDWQAAGYQVVAWRQKSVYSGWLQ